MQHAVGLVDFELKIAQHVHTQQPVHARDGLVVEHSNVGLLNHIATEQQRLRLVDVATGVPIRRVEQL